MENVDLLSHDCWQNQATLSSDAAQVASILALELALEWTKEQKGKGPVENKASMAILQPAFLCISQGGAPALLAQDKQARLSRTPGA